jgi:hypothetical protein
MTIVALKVDVITMRLAEHLKHCRTNNCVVTLNWITSRNNGLHDISLTDAARCFISAYNGNFTFS